MYKNVEKLLDEIICKLFTLMAIIMFIGFIWSALTLNGWAMFVLAISSMACIWASAVLETNHDEKKKDISEEV